LLSRGWLSDRFEIRHCEIGHVRHKPGRNCLIRYDIAIRDRVCGEESLQILCGRVYGDGESESRWKRASREPLVDVDAGPTLAHLPELGMVLWAFPNERKLRGLDVLLDPIRLREQVLPRVLRQRVEAVQAEMIRYIPEHGCTVRVRVNDRVLYGKIQGTDAGRRTYEVARQIRPEHVWFDESTQSLWQSEVPGRTAAWSDLAACGTALARFHQQSVSGLPPVVATSGHFELDERAELLMRETERLVCRAPKALATLHGDLHLKNFLVDEDGQASLIDLDTLCSGDPLEDLGSFAASLYHRAVLGDVSIEEATRLIRQFADSYAASVPWPVPEQDLFAQTARAILTQRVRRAITRRKGDVVNALLDLAQRLIEDSRCASDWMDLHAAHVASRPGTILDVHYKTYRKRTSWRKSHVTVAASSSTGIKVERWSASDAALLVAWRFPADPKVPWLAEAADPARVLRHLPFPADRVASVEVLNYRPENRMVARYGVVVGESEKLVYGKTYSDDRGLRVHERFEALAERGLLPVRSLGYAPAIRTVFQEAFDGVPLREHANRAVLLRRAGARLAELHSSGIACRDRFTFAGMHADLTKKMAKLAVACPNLADRLVLASRRLGSSIVTLPACQPCVVHGDFHIRQLMVRDGVEVALLDFDEIGMGDPAEDIGHFLADLRGDGFDDAFVREAKLALLEGYRVAGDSTIQPQRLRWHTAYQLLTRAYRSLLQLKPEFDVRVEQHLQWAEQQL
jgi:aminoglycoside phosphotransferase (APT) family kinase protein